jgi:type III secretory pathway component EscV
VFTALLGTAAVSLLLGLVPAFRVLLLVHLVVDILLVAYVAMLVRQRTLAAEREMKVRFLPESRPMEPALLRRSVN